MSSRRIVNPTAWFGRLRAAGSGLLILGAAALQLLLLVRTQILPTALRLQTVRSYEPIERSAMLAFGEEFAGFVGFLRTTIPADGKVILPPIPLDVAIGSPSIMQYYLFPRRVDNCGEEEVEACVLRATGKRTYIVAIPGFPPRDLAEQSKTFVQFVGERGVYAPGE